MALSSRYFAALMFAGWTSASFADADGPEFFAVTGVEAKDVLNVRAAPSATSEKIGSIPHDGRRIRNLGCQGLPSFAEWQQMTPAERKASGKRHWCRVRYGDVEGWASGRYLREDSSGP